MINRITPFIRVLLPFWATFLIIELYFAIAIGGDLSLIQYLQSIYFGFLFATKVLFFPFLIAAIAGGRFPKASYLLSLIYCFLVLIIHFALHNYVKQTGLLLGADLYGYSLSEIIHTVNSSSTSGLSSVLIFMGEIVVFTGLIYWISKKEIKHLWTYIYTPMLLLSFVLPNGPSSKSLDESTFNLIANPSNHFWTKSINYWLGSGSNVSSELLGKYPFLHKTDSSNPLGQWIEKGKKPPNIVIVAVEGLGADFVGRDAQYGGFTPFLDSLLDKSIYFKNALSNTGRTFGVLPTILGSLPYSQSGFMSMGVDMPDHFTLFSWLKKAGYHSSFFYGGNANFDGQDVFLERQKTDYIMDESKFPSNYQKMKSNNEGFSWGYGDRDVFAFSMEKLATFPSAPKISFYMTITTHEPFLVPDEQYQRIADEKITSLQSQVSSAEHKIFEEYSNVFACLLYTDDAIRQLINSYKKRPDFENTLFIITGDHRLIPVPTENRLARFHVPLIIYSPLVKESIISKQLVAHSQIAPSIVSLLSQSYNLLIPNEVAFISGPLPTATSFGSQLDIALMRNKNELEEYVSGLSILSNKNLYELKEGFKLKEVSDEALKSAISKKLNLFITNSTLAINENRLIPKDLIEMEAIKYFDFDNKEMAFLKERDLLKTAPDTLLFEARSLAFAKDYEKSRIILTYGLSKSPNYHDMRVLLARTFAWEGQFDSAYHYLDETLGRAEKYEDAYSAYVDVLYWDDKGIETFNMIETGLKYYPESYDLKARMARYYLQNNEIKKATTLVNEVLKKDPRNELANQLKSRL